MPQCRTRSKKSRAKVKRGSKRSSRSHVTRSYTQPCRRYKGSSSSEGVPHALRGPTYPKGSPMNGLQEIKDSLISIKTTLATTDQVDKNHPGRDKLIQMRKETTRQLIAQNKQLAATAQQFENIAKKFKSDVDAWKDEDERSATANNLLLLNKRKRD